MFCTEHKGIKNARNIAAIVSGNDEISEDTNQKEVKDNWQVAIEFLK